MFVPALLVLVAAVLLYYYLTKNYSYWEKRGVPYAEPSLLFGNTVRIALLRTTIGKGLQEIYEKFENCPYVGIYEFRKPVLLLRDLQVIKLILIKDFAHFPDRGIMLNENVDPLSAHLIHLTGSRWKTLRTKLTPVFTSVRIRNISKPIMETSQKFKQFLKLYADNEDTIEMRDFAAKFTTEIISSCCFGFEANAIQNENSEFRTMCKKLLDPSLIITVKRQIRYFLPNIYKRLQLSLTYPEVRDYFNKILRDMIRHRETNNVVRNDFFQVFLQMKNVNRENGIKTLKEGEVDERSEVRNNAKNDEQDMVIDDDVIVAQIYIFLLAGFETAAAAISFAAYELAANPEIQERLYNEIRTVLGKHDSLSSDAISEMKYLDCVVREALRKYPPVGMVPRICNKTYKIPGTNLIIEKGMKVLIPIYAIHHDPRYYEDPDKFNPDRFLDENKKQRDNCTFLPFGEGPRICIAYRFAFIQVKAGLISLLEDYEVVLSPKTSSPLEYELTANVLMAKSGIWLKIRHRAK